MWIKNETLILNLSNYDGVIIREITDSEYELSAIKFDVDANSRFDFCGRFRLGRYEKDEAKKIISEIEEHICNNKPVYKLPKSI
jgi:hypothetical protein